METATRWLAADRYEVGEVVGRGGYGMVRRGLDRKTGREVALKMLSPEAGRNADAVERMLREQQAMLALSGTCAVTAIDLFRLPSGAPCLVMEWLEGCDLEQQLSTWEEAGELGTPEQLLTVMKPLALTLERAHEIGILHRDIKPANVFLAAGPTPSIRLLDFGLSRMRSAAPLTALGMVMGSPSYIAPETWRGNSALLDGRADLFALAVIVFRFLTGQIPFDVPDLIGKMTAVTSGPRPSVLALRPGLAPSIDAWMSRALAVEPNDRFQTGGDFYESLAAALRGESWPAAEEAEAPTQRGIEDAAPERKNALSNAWKAAASLLKRFTGPRDAPSNPPLQAPPKPPSITPPQAPSNAPPKPTKPPLPPRPAPPTAASTPSNVDDAGDRKTLWLDSTELQDVTEMVSSAPAEAAEEPKAEEPKAAEPNAVPAPTKAKSKRKKRKSRRKRKG
jgi:eukaryotic-like serine/threonine-protein kinase